MILVPLVHYFLEFRLSLYLHFSSALMGRPSVLPCLASDLCAGSCAWRIALIQTKLAMRFCIASSMTRLALHLNVDSAGVQLDDGVHGVAGMSVRTD